MLMFYNGNDMGFDGFGVAEAVNAHVEGASHVPA
jgi:hypothetical protein